MAESRANITLISPYGDESIALGKVTALGLRLISSYLKQHGHHVNIIFLSSRNFTQLYSDQILEDICQITKDSDLIGFSLMTNYFYQVQDLTQRIKAKKKIPIIWGGIHPTVKPEECIQVADMICIGDGEETMLELANQIHTGDIEHIQSLWIRRGENIIKNEVRPLEENLDKFPFQDYQIETHYFIRDGRLVRMTSDLLSEASLSYCFSQDTGHDLAFKTPHFMIMTSRNCPYNCTYCCNNALRKIFRYKGNFLRMRSVENVIEELVDIKTRFPFFNWIDIEDDNFFMRSEEEIALFCKLYKEKIHLPIRCLIAPREVTDKKLQMLTEAGLHSAEIGVQAYNDETLKTIYKRPLPKKTILQCVELLNKYKQQIPHPHYHFIVDNPYETQESRWETAFFAATLPLGTQIHIYPFSAFPGTEMYQRLKDDGVIQDEKKEIYLKTWHMRDVQRLDYYTFLLYLCRLFKTPTFLPRFPFAFFMRRLLKKDLSFLFQYNRIKKILMTPVFNVKRKLTILVMLILYGVSLFKPGSVPWQTDVKL